MKAERDSAWMCNGDGSIVNKEMRKNIPCYMLKVLDAYKANTSTWRPQLSSQPIAYCLSETPTELCKIQFSLPIMIIVVVFNLAKAIIMLYVGLVIEARPLMTMGDTVASYLARPDTLTDGMCLANKKTISNQARDGVEWVKGGVIYRGARRRLFASASVLRWSLCILL
jgi:hypothetical protein